MDFLLYLFLQFTWQTHLVLFTSPLCCFLLHDLPHVSLSFYPSSLEYYIRYAYLNLYYFHHLTTILKVSYVSISNLHDIFSQEMYTEYQGKCKNRNTNFNFQLHKSLRPINYYREFKKRTSNLILKIRIYNKRNIIYI